MGLLSLKVQKKRALVWYQLASGSPRKQKDPLYSNQGWRGLDQTHSLLFTTITRAASLSTSGPEQLGLAGTSKSSTLRTCVRPRGAGWRPFLAFEEDDHQLLIFTHNLGNDHKL